MPSKPGSPRNTYAYRAAKAAFIATAPPVCALCSEMKSPAGGPAGLTLGGGFGYLTRQFGWTSDNVQSIDLATACGHEETATCSGDFEAAAATSA